MNRAVAVAMCDGPEAGLTLIDAVLEHGDLANYYLVHSARADMYRRLGRTAEARASYEKALALTQQEPERQFLQERIRQYKTLSRPGTPGLSCLQILVEDLHTDIESAFCVPTPNSWLMLYTDSQTQNRSAAPFPYCLHLI
jgi:hypothetical protein